MRRRTGAPSVRIVGNVSRQLRVSAMAAATRSARREVIAPSVLPSFHVAFGSRVRFSDEVELPVVLSLLFRSLVGR